MSARYSCWNCGWRFDAGTVAYCQNCRVTNPADNGPVEQAVRFARDLSADGWMAENGKAGLIVGPYRFVIEFHDTNVDVFMVDDRRPPENIIWFQDMNLNEAISLARWWKRTRR